MEIRQFGSQTVDMFVPNSSVPSPDVMRYYFAKARSNDLSENGNFLHRRLRAKPHHDSPNLYGSTASSGTLLHSRTGKASPYPRTIPSLSLKPATEKLGADRQIT